MPVICPPAEQAEPLSDGRLMVRAPAKLNLGLRVGPAGEGGYHPLDSLVAKVTLYDELVFSPRGDGQVVLTTEGLAAGPDEQNLALRAARVLAQSNPGCGASIHLRKRIAPGAGLGGGSSDAAATLAALNNLWELGLGRPQLAEIGLTLGSDVPLFFAGPISRMTGRGEILEPVELPAFAAVLVIPPVHSATAEVYRAYDATGPQALAPLDLQALIELPPSRWSSLLANDLQAPAEQLRGEIARWREQLEQATGQAAHLTGSGSGLFVLADDESSALALYDRLEPQLREAARVVLRNPW